MIKLFSTQYGKMPFGYVGDWAEQYKDRNKKGREEIKKALKRLHQLAGLTWADIYEPQIRTSENEIYCSYGWGQRLEAEKMPVDWYEINQIWNIGTAGFGDREMIDAVLKHRLIKLFDFNRRLIDFIDKDDKPNDAIFKRHLIGLYRNI